VAHRYQAHRKTRIDRRARAVPRQQEERLAASHLHSGIQENPAREERWVVMAEVRMAAEQVLLDVLEMMGPRKLP